MKQDLYHLDSMFLLYLNRTAIYNPDYIQVYINDKEMEDFVKRFYPLYFDDYNCLVVGETRSDLPRYMLLYLFGGLYIDLDMVLYPSYPLKDLLINLYYEFVSAIDVSDDMLFNAFLATYQHNPLMLKFVERGIYNQHHHYYNCDWLDISGPRMIGRVFKEYLGMSIMDPLPKGRFVVKDTTATAYNNHHHHSNSHSRLSHSHRHNRSSIIASTSSTAAVSSPSQYHHYQLFYHDNMKWTIVRGGGSTVDNVSLPIMRDRFDEYDNLIKSNNKEGLRYYEKWQKRIDYRGEENNSYFHSHFQAQIIDIKNIKKEELLPKKEQTSYSTIYYMHNKLLRGFPDHATFVAMGMASCAHDYQLKITEEQLQHFAFGPLFSTNLTANVIDLKVHIPPLNLSAAVRTMPIFTPKLQQRLQADLMQIRQRDDPHLVKMVAPLIVNYTIFIKLVDKYIGNGHSGSSISEKKIKVLV